MRIVLIAFLTLLCPMPVASQQYPERPLTILSGSGAGSAVAAQEVATGKPDG